MIKRTLSDYARHIFTKYPVITITGPRQSGKTTLARQAFSHKPYANLENPVVRQFAIEDSSFILPTVITHSVIAVSAAYGFRVRKESLKFFTLSIVCSILPDADVMGYHYLYIPYHHFFGHRGFFHSPFFAALLSMFIVYIFYRKEATFSNRWWKYFLYFFILTTSHGLLDALTNGGHGIALLSPIANSRYFFPWTPIEVSPLGIKGFLGQRGLKVLTNELLWIWAPSFLIVIFFKIKRNKKKKEEIFDNT